MGPEIRRSPVDMVKFPMIYRVLAPSQVVGRISAINSTKDLWPQLTTICWLRRLLSESDSALAIWSIFLYELCMLLVVSLKKKKQQARRGIRHYCMGVLISTWPCNFMRKTTCHVPFHLHKLLDFGGTIAR